MPMSVNVGLSRKASRDYQSTGVSINVTAELDSALLQKPEELQRQIDGLYGQAEQAMARQVQACARSAPPRRQNGTSVSSGSGPTTTARPRGNGKVAGNGNGHTLPTPMTASQRQAIAAIAERVGTDADQESNALFDVDFGDLTIRQASALIDHLKTLAPAEDRNGRH